eukprot:5740482-Amphidinium_carterae.1
MFIGAFWVLDSCAVANAVVPRRIAQELWSGVTVLEPQLHSRARDALTSHVRAHSSKSFASPAPSYIGKKKST